jgi:sugar lactone lactonase YvrE
MVSPDLGGSDIDGIYRVDGPDRFTVVADIGAFSLAHPPVPAFFIPTGVQYSMQPYRGGFLVADGHHNRVLRVHLDGDISEAITFPDIVPTGLALRGQTVYLAEAGPVPHLPENGKVVAFTTRRPVAHEVASGAPLLVDVEFGRGGQLYALSQGHFTPGHDEGSPADPNTGSLVRVHRDGTMTPVGPELNQPTSLEFIGSTAYVVTLNGEVWSLSSRHH